MIVTILSRIRSAGLKIVRRRKGDLGTMLSVGICTWGFGHGQPLLPREPRTATSHRRPLRLIFQSVKSSHWRCQR
jgi:hypothetical protein